MNNFELILRKVESRLSFSQGKTLSGNYPYFRLYDVDDIITKDIIEEVCSDSMHTVYDVTCIVCDVLQR